MNANVAPAGQLEAVLASGLLVVERDEASAEILLRFLKATGYSNAISVVGSGGVIDLLYELDIDVVLIDSEVLISVDGTDVLEQIRHSHIYRHLPVFVLAAEADRALRLRVLAQGATDILTKPVDAREMRLRLQNALAIKVYRDLVVYRDDLTGLSNRERYTDRLDWAIKYSQRHGIIGAALHIDLDRFKKIVEALGWGTGNRLLRAAAANLANCVRDTDVLARLDLQEQAALLSRLSGNEFTVLLCGIDRPESAAIVANRILEVVRTPFRSGNHELITSCSVGIAIFPDDGENADEIISAANNALQEAKRNGGNNFRFYSPAVNEHAVRRLSLEADLRHAVEVDDELSLAFQPQIDIATGAIVSAEALLRWRHPLRGMVGPGDFIPLAEESSLINGLGDKVLVMACRQIRKWLDAGLPLPRIALNLSAIQLREKPFVERLGRTLRRHGLTGSHICIELTESAIMDDMEQTLPRLQMLRDMDIELSIDDFGTGYSSLSYLKRMPLQELKIDRSFLLGIHTDEHSAAIVDAIISMGHKLGLRIVAEGVETLPQLEFLRAHDCDIYQGYFFSPAVTPERFAGFLTAAAGPAA